MTMTNNQIMHENLPRVSHISADLRSHLLCPSEIPKSFSPNRIAPAARASDRTSLKLHHTLAQTFCIVSILVIFHPIFSRAPIKRECAVEKKTNALRIKRLEFYQPVIN